MQRVSHSARKCLHQFNPLTTDVLALEINMMNRKVGAELPRPFLLSALVVKDIDMKPHISVLTLGVSNLENSLRFYRDGLGLPTEGIIGREFEHGAVAFFNLAGGLKLAIWAQNDLVYDTGLPKNPICTTAGSIGHNVQSREDVDDIMIKARHAGAEIIKTPQDTFYGGYAGYFTDPDGHLWEIVWNPQMLPPD